MGEGDGGHFVEARANCVPGDPFLAGAVLTLRGIHERKVLEERLAHQAFHDPLTNLDEAWPIAERLQQAVRLPFVVGGREIVLGASLGIASSEGAGETAGDLLRDADVAMYRAKSEGKGRMVLFEASMQTAVRERLELEADLRGAVDRGGLALVYQPIVALATGRTVGAEALLRWDHPTRGRLRSADFLASAESAGALPAIERWVVEEAADAPVSGRCSTTSSGYPC
jgi:predicted signal transduction protein with EAL and GGDEF domain